LASWSLSIYFTMILLLTSFFSKLKDCLSSSASAARFALRVFIGRKFFDSIRFGVIGFDLSIRFDRGLNFESIASTSLSKHSWERDRCIFSSYSLRLITIVCGDSLLGGLFDFKALGLSVKKVWLKYDTLLAQGLNRGEHRVTLVNTFWP
jgi:hypothetical protein